MWNLKAIKWLSISHCKFHTLKHYFRFLCMLVLDMKMNLLFSQFDILTFFFTETLFLTALISIPRADFASSLPFILLYPLLLLPPCAVGESPQQDWLYLQASCMTLMLTAGAVTKFFCCVSEFYPFSVAYAWLQQFLPNWMYICTQIGFLNYSKHHSPYSHFLSSPPQWISFVNCPCLSCVFY